MKRSVVLAGGACLGIALSLLPGGASRPAWGAGADGEGGAQPAIVMLPAHTAPATSLPAGAVPRKVVRPAAPLRVLPQTKAAVPGPVTPQPSGAVQTIMNETFEGIFPGAGWTIYGDPSWDDTYYASYGGNWSAWCGASSLDPAGGYTDNMNAWMVYGPFSLADATDGTLTFQYKNYSEPSLDNFGCYVSIDGMMYYGWSVTGDQNTWQAGSMDLKNVYTLGNLCGQSQVWIAFIFSSNESVSGPTYSGAYVDDVLLTKSTGGTTLPNLAPFTPSGWINPIVVSNKSGTSTDDSPLTQIDTIYVDWAAINSGNAATAARFYTRLLLDGVGRGSWYVDPPLNPDYYVYVTDFSLGQLSPGDHTIRIELDSTGAIAEDSETDNACQRTITIQVVPGQIGGTTWNDVNGSATRNASEPALQGWKIYIDQNQNGQWDGGEPFQLSGADGRYSFTNLTPGTHWLGEVQQAHWTRTFPGGQTAMFAAPSTVADQLAPEQLARIEVHVQNSPPKRPLGYASSAVAVLSESAVMLGGVPTSEWTYGCSATSAGMIMGYYDRRDYPNMYTGPANGGVAPLTDLGSACSLIATRNGFDGRTTSGHVDDYWTGYANAGPDPFEYYWAEHAWGDCTADYMGTNQWKYDFSSFPNPDGTRDANTDGSTIIFSSGTSRLYDFIPPASLGQPATECCHGLRLFAESRGYTVLDNYTQGTASGGFSFSDYMAEIDAGRPVLIHVQGHTMVGVGYEAASQAVYLHDTWDNLVHTMTWGGSYSGMAMFAVSVLHLATVLPPGMHSVNVSPAQSVTGIDFGSKTRTGDINADGHVNATDRSLLSASWGKQASQTGFNAACDLNSNGSVNVADLLMMADNWGQ